MGVELDIKFCQGKFKMALLSARRVMLAELALIYEMSKITTS